MNINESFQFSIITPVYNRADCIVRCLESVANQKFDSFEMIVVDDGSEDQTLNKIQMLKSKFKHLNIISYSENRGVNFARNRGIEQAKGNYIIFLDSDDILTPDALNTIDLQINVQKGYSHYLFGVSDRISDNALPNEPMEFSYKDWLSGKISGDFAHVIKPSCFDGLMFVEEFRIYEALNWLRVLRQNKRQLYIPVTVSDREREREDSVTRESILRNKKSMQNAYNFLYQFIDWYGNDLRNSNLNSILNKKIQKTLFLGIALEETVRNNKLYTQFTNITLKIRLLKALNYKLFSPIIFRLIQLRSTLNQARRK